MSTNEDSGALTGMQPGDVLVSHSTAVREYEISIVPHAAHAVFPSHDIAVSAGRAEADARGVDAWLTEDQTHVVRFASHRLKDE
jgi:3-hydroxyisobutyrate dehydrogenase-like beta-hydroxyacid dehydrogenase